DGHTQRRLRTREHAIDDEEERVLDVKSALSKFAGKMSKHPKNEEEVFQRFVQLGLLNEKSNLFESPLFQNWASSVAKGFKTNSTGAERAIAAALMRVRSDNDANLTTMFIGAEKSADTKDLAVKLEQAHMSDWLRNERSADEVFKLLKLDDDVDNVLSNPLLGSWMAYVEKLDGDPYMLLLEKLKTSELTNTANKLVMMLKEAKENPVTRAVATKLEAAQLDKWQKEGETAASVFKLLDLDQHKFLFLDYSDVRAWVTYVMKLDPLKSDDTILSVLTSHHSEPNLCHKHGAMPPTWQQSLKQSFSTSGSSRRKRRMTSSTSR
ncbi:hypothetical protein PHYSODRAFT_504760, partial [Phytophthora sojae]